MTFALLAIGWPQQVWSYGDLETKTLKQLERGYADLDVKGLNVAGNEQFDAHGPLPMSRRIGFSFRYRWEGPCIYPAPRKVSHRSGRTANARSPAHGGALWRRPQRALTYNQTAIIYPEYIRTIMNLELPA